MVVVRRAPVRSEADREGGRAGDLREVPAVPVGGQLPETPGSDERGKEGDLTGRRVGPAADQKRGRPRRRGTPGVRGGEPGKAPSKRNAEVMAVEQVMRWPSEVSRFAPDRLAAFDELIADALNNPAPVQKADQ